jgi:DNA-binding MarR family transcriptional regulator
MDQTNVDSTNSASDFARLVAFAARFFNGIPKWEAFAVGEIDLPQWVLLAHLTAKDGSTISILSKTIGVSRSQTLSIAEALADSGFIQLTEDTDATAKQAFITEAGSDRLYALNLAIEQHLQVTLGEKIGLIRAVGSFFDILMRARAEKG